MEELHPDLESFRQQWRAEVSARSKVDDSTRPSKGPVSQSAKVPPKQPGPSRPVTESSIRNKNEEEDFAEDNRTDHASHHIRRHSANKEVVEGFGGIDNGKEPRSALEYYEKAVERENQGSLGDSLSLYRKAYRMDSTVDQKYKKKHFPPSYFASKPTNLNPSNTSITIPNTAHHSLDGSPQTIKDLLAGFQGLAIQPALPEMEGMPIPPCPISTLPHEILLHILAEVAVLDIASFARLAQVCKRLAYIVSTEEQIWKKVCLGSEVGFGTMHYQWACEITGEPLEGDEIDPNLDGPAMENGKNLSFSKGLLSTENLLQEVYSSSWQRMFRLRPRIRFNGCYISTVNYIRAGQASPSQITWNSPVHIITFYRYLRFFRDGTVISLQTTTEPADVVPFLTKKLQASHKNGQGAHLPSAVMQNATRGRWRLSMPSISPEGELNDVEGDLFVETEGIGKYIFRMELSLRSVGKGARNNKLAWKGYWNYNKLSDDWAEFGRKNEKPFFCSRVKSYGVGE